MLCILGPVFPAFLLQADFFFGAVFPEKLGAGRWGVLGSLAEAGVEGEETEMHVHPSPPSQEKSG